MAPKLTIALDSEDSGACKLFTIEEAKDAETIRAKFKQEKAPVFLYQDDDEEKRKEVGKDTLEAGCVYVWRTGKEVWQNKEIVQNALFCSEAVYAENPLSHLKNAGVIGTFHTINEIVAVGTYGEQKQRCMMALTENYQKESMLIVAFKGSETSTDWKDNFTFTLQEDIRYLGKVHEGFLQRGNTIDLEDIRKIACINCVTRIVVCGHSSGGAVSSVVHLNLLFDEGSPLERNKLINVTFGAPFFGNESLQKHAQDKEYSRNMFHFASVNDIIPSLLSLGHTFKTMKQEIQSKLSDATSGWAEVARKMGKGWVNKNQAKVAVLEELCIQALTNKAKEDARFPKIREIYEHLKKNLTTSTLQTQYTESQYVPIGNYIILADGRDAEKMNQGSKIIERVLQAATEHTAANPSVIGILNGHSMQNYSSLFRASVGGFEAYTRQKIKLHKSKLGECLQQMSFKNLSALVCAHPSCQKSQPPQLFNQPNLGTIVSCQNCQDNVHMEEYLFHKGCSDAFHTGEHTSHFVMELKPDAFTDKNPEQIKAILERSHAKESLWAYTDKSIVTLLTSHLTILKPYTVTVGYTLSETSEHVLKSVTPQLGSMVKWNAAFTGILLAVSVGDEFIGYLRGKMSGKEFTRRSICHFGGALGGLALGTAVEFGAAAAIGAATVAGFAAGPLAILAILGVGGVIVASWAGNKYGSKLTNNLLKFLGWEEELPEVDRKALIFVECMLLLETPCFEELRSKDVDKCYRRQALLHHPDKLPPSATDEDRRNATAAFHAVGTARAYLMAYCDQPNCISEACKLKIQELWLSMSKEVNINKFLERMDNWTRGQVLADKQLTHVGD